MYLKYNIIFLLYFIFLIHKSAIIKVEVIFEMRAGKALKLLQVSRSTLTRYRRKGYIRYTLLPTGQFLYNDDDVYRMINKNMDHRYIIAYSRVSTYHQKKDLKTQAKELEEYCQLKGYHLDQEYSEIGSGLTFNRRKQFFKMLDLIVEGKVEAVIITHKDRLSRVAFNMFEHLFAQFSTKIIVVDDQLNPKTDEQELFSEIISLLHCFAMRNYSSRQHLKKQLSKKVTENAADQEKIKKNQAKGVS